MSKTTIEYQMILAGTHPTKKVVDGTLWNISPDGTLWRMEDERTFPTPLHIESKQRIHQVTRARRIMDDIKNKSAFHSIALAPFSIKVTSRHQHTMSGGNRAGMSTPMMDYLGGFHQTLHARHPQSESTLSREQWLARCAAHFQSKAALDGALAMDMAESQLEFLANDLTENPEQAAEDEMSYWTAD